MKDHPDHRRTASADGQQPKEPATVGVYLLLHRRRNAYLVAAHRVGIRRALFSRLLHVDFLDADGNVTGAARFVESISFRGRVRADSVDTLHPSAPGGPGPAPMPPGAPPTMAGPHPDFMPGAN